MGSEAGFAEGAEDLGGCGPRGGALGVVGSSGSDRRESRGSDGGKSREQSLVWTVQSLLDWATVFFKRQGLESPHLEAEILLAHALQCKRIELYLRYANEVGADDLARFKDAVVRRSRHEPAAYITGVQSFFSLEFTVTPDVLIPRPDTEVLVEAALEIIAEARARRTDEGQPLRAVDVGTGSGNIAVCLAKFVPDLYVLGVDASDKALAVAVQNAQRHGVTERCRFVNGSLLQPLSGEPAFSKPDLIVANLPYVSTRDYETLAPGIRQFEPAQALLGGTDGLDVIREILPQASGRLSASSHLLLEIGAGQAELLRAQNFSDNCFALGLVLEKIQNDLAGIPRVAWFKKI